MFSIYPYVLYSGGEVVKTSVLPFDPFIFSALSLFQFPPTIILFII